jgi:hypothetical protein
MTVLIMMVVEVEGTSRGVQPITAAQKTNFILETSSLVTYIGAELHKHKRQLNWYFSLFLQLTN